MNKLFGIAIFALGAALGAIASWKIAKQRYERIAQEEIDSVKETFARLREKDKDMSVIPEEKKPTFNREKPDITEYAKVVNGMGYTDYTKTKASETEVMDAEEYKAPYVITPDEFGVFDDYDRISFMYYADGVLADDDDTPVENIAGTVGVDAVDHFGEYEDDSVFVRNERLKVDYEILRSLKTYEEVLEEKPYLRRN